ncbi:glycosyltransferase [Hymenobacter sediminis]|uniref:glycosyltransferase family 4 protein n=1 Tax=Hymenobacter sediminis TaxID=2218621 RepID=UPI000DA6427B|nr:glycosyltransferase family 4 protein [Hymenobacter sediminis]RPD44969.1 glycosyltransferase [Hymenobacter sediminis]
MNIILSAYACNPEHGGEDGNGFHWAWELAQSGQRVWCFTTPENEGATTRFLTDHAHDPASHRLSFYYLHVPALVQFLYRWQFGVYLHYMVWQFLAWRRARELSSHVEFDLVHHATYSSLKMGSWLWRLGKPMVYGPVGGAQRAPIAFRQYVPDWFRTETLRSAFTWVLTRFDLNLRQNLQHATLVLASNDESAELARRLGAQQVKVFLDTGLPDKFQGAVMPDRQPGPVLRLLWVGRLYPNKALPLVLDALSQVDKRVAWHLTVVGDGPMHDRVAGWLEQYKVTDRVTWVGQVPWLTVRSLMETHDVFMFASLRDSFASQFMEAMATGLPIITLNHQGARTFLPAAAAIKVPVEVPSVTTAALARAVEHLASHPAERLRMGRASYEFACAQTWPARIQQLLTLLDTLGVVPPPQHAAKPVPSIPAAEQFAPEPDLLAS